MPCNLPILMRLISIGGFAFGLSQLLFVWLLVKCIRGGDKATDQVWEGAEGLEWQLSSPPPYHSFTTPPESEITGGDDVSAANTQP